MKQLPSTSARGALSFVQDHSGPCLPDYRSRSVRGGQGTGVSLLYEFWDSCLPGERRQPASGARFCSRRGSSRFLAAPRGSSGGSSAQLLAAPRRGSSLAAPRRRRRYPTSEFLHVWVLNGRKRPPYVRGHARGEEASASVSVPVSVSGRCLRLNRRLFGGVRVCLGERKTETQE